MTQSLSMNVRVFSIEVVGLGLVFPVDVARLKEVAFLWLMGTKWDMVGVGSGRSWRRLIDGGCDIEMFSISVLAEQWRWGFY